MVDKQVHASAGDTAWYPSVWLGILMHLRCAHLQPETFRVFSRGVTALSGMPEGAVTRPVML